MSNYYEIRWLCIHGEIVEKFDDLVLAQERVLEIRKEYGFAPNIFERKRMVLK